MLRFLLPPVHFLRPDGQTLTDGSFNERKVQRAYRTGTNPSAMNAWVLLASPASPSFASVKLLQRQEF